MGRWEEERLKTIRKGEGNKPPPIALLPADARLGHIERC